MNKFLNQIILGDSLEILKKIPDNTIDAVITDPPYCSGGRGISEKTKLPKTKYNNSSGTYRPDFAGDAKDQRLWLHWCILWINECQRILKPGGYFLMFSDWRQLPAATDAMQMGEISWRGIVTWDKGRGSRAPHKGYFRHQCEYIVWGTKGQCRKIDYAGPFDGCFSFPIKQSDKFHLTGKPTALMEKLVQIVPKGGVIVDPFAGSGTTLVAAKLHEINYIGCEKTLDYYNIARKRLNFI